MDGPLTAAFLHGSSVFFNQGNQQFHRLTSSTSLAARTEAEIQQVFMSQATTKAAMIASPAGTAEPELPKTVPNVLFYRGLNNPGYYYYIALVLLMSLLLLKMQGWEMS